MSTYGSSAAPSQNTINYDSIMTASLMNYSPTLTDNVSKSNGVFYKMQEQGMYKSKDGGTSIQENLMYTLGNAEWFDGYDQLGTDPTDGITAAFFEWRQLSVPVSISRKEERQNSGQSKIIDLLKTKITQAELGIKEKFSKALLQGSLASGGTSITTADSNNMNGATGIDPLPLYAHVTPSTNVAVGNLNGSSATWWQNKALQSTLSGASKATDFLLEATSIYNNCSKGPGGPPKAVLVDQWTHQLWQAAYFQQYRRAAESDNNFPFENFKFRNAVVFWDEFMIDAYSGVVPDESNYASYYGTAYFFNPQFYGVVYDSQTNFVSTPFKEPVNQAAKVSHILWMGNTVMSNRRKIGVWNKIPRSLTWSM